MVTVTPNFEAFYGETHRRVRAALVAAIGEQDLAFDAADEAFARALIHWGSVGTMDAPRAWVFRVALNVARRKARRRSLEQKLLRRDHPVEELPAPAGEIWTLGAALPERQRLAVVLRYVGDLTEEQVATAMGVKRGTVSRTLRDAQAQLAGLLADDVTVGEQP